MTRRAILYVRVSTDEQAKNGYSLRTQLEACEAYAAQHAFVVPGDDYRQQDDYSGAKLARPGLDRVRARLEAGQAEALIVYSTDRLTRSLGHLVLLREECQRLGVELHFVNRGKSEDSPEHRMTENIEGVFNDYWREKIREATMRGKRRKAADGRWVGGSMAPFGYQRVGKGKAVRLQILEAEARIVRQIFDWYTGAGGQPKLSMGKIAARLTAGGVATPSRGKKGRGWSRDTVRCIVEDATYLGELSFAGTLIYLPDLAVVSRHTWAVAQEQRGRNKLLSERGKRREYLLAGHLRCSCQRALVGVTRRPRQAGPEYAYYTCGAQWSNRHLTACRARSVPLAEADAKVWAWLAELLTSPETMRAGLRRLAERREVELAPRRNRLALIAELIAQCEAKIERWLVEFGDEADGFMREAVKGKIRETAQVRDELLAERALLSADLAQGALQPEDEARILALSGELAAGIREADFETKRYLLERLDVRGVLREDDAGRWLETSCAVPGWELSVVLDDPGDRSASHTSGTCGSVRQSCTRISRDWGRVVIFSASLPLDGRPVPSADLAVELFAPQAAPQRTTSALS